MGGYATNPDTNATSEITGSGTANYMAKFTAAQVIGNSTVQDDGTTVTIGSRMMVTPQVATSGAVVGFTFTGSANTGQTASTEINRLLLTTSSRQWATGAITTQREVYITSPTYSFVGASTITNAYTLYVEAPTAGSNATISSPYALGLDGHLRFANSNPVISSGSAITLQSSSGANVVLNSGSTTQTYVIFRGQGTERFSLTTGTNTSAAVSYAVYSPASNTGQTASTEINGFLYNSYTRTWAAGAITTQREQYIKTVTYAFASASTITNAYGLYVEAPTAGSNATITNNWAIAAYGSLAILNNGILKLGNAATTGLVAGALAATTNASIVIYDSTGQAYRIPCII